MSTAIHKVIGYGLVDVKTKNNDIVDPRINMMDGIMAKHLHYDHKSFTKEDYSRWLKNRYNKAKNIQAKLPYSWERRAVEESDRSQTLSDCFIHQGEFGLQRVLCVVPFGNKNWQRRDSMIDYVEERKGSKFQRDRVTVYEDGFYPHIEYWDKRDGRKLHTGDACELRRELNARTPAEKKSKHIPWRCQEIAEQLGFKTDVECIENMVPAVPERVQILCEFCKLLADPKAIYQFRPMLYVYWS